jgi:hypothetical protein
MLSYEVGVRSHREHRWHITSAHDNIDDAMVVAEVKWNGYSEADRESQVMIRMVHDTPGRLRMWWTSLNPEPWEGGPYTCCSMCGDNGVIVTLDQYGEPLFDIECFDCGICHDCKGWGKAYEGLNVHSQPRFRQCSTCLGTGRMKKPVDSLDHTEYDGILDGLGAVVSHIANVCIADYDTGERFAAAGQIEEVCKELMKYAHAHKISMLPDIEGTTQQKVLQSITKLGLCYMIR